MYVKAWVTAGAKKETFEIKSPDHFKISVKEEAVQNFANHRVIALVAAHFSVPPSKVRIINGHHSPSKLLAVND